MKEFIVTAASAGYGTAATFDNIAAAPVGSIAFYNGGIAGSVANGALIPSGTSLFTSYDTILPVIGRAANSNYAAMGIAHQPIDMNSLVVTYAAYVAPVGKIMIIGGSNSTYTASAVGSFNIPTTLTTVQVGNPITIRVINTNLPMEEQNRVSTYSYTILASDTSYDIASATNIYYKLAAVINADTNAIVTAAPIQDGSSHYCGIVLTAATAGVDFEAVGDDLLANADIIEYFNASNILLDNVVTANAPQGSYLLANSNGNGTVAQLQDWELNAWIEDGKENSLYLEQYMWQLGSSLVTGTTYDLFLLTWNSPNITNANIDIKATRIKQELVIAVPHSDALVAILRTMFNV
jgi:hypothetical protein